MAGENIYRKLILVEADTSGLTKLDQDTRKAEEVLSRLGVSGEKVSKVMSEGTTVTSKYGQVTSQSMYKIETESGKTFNMIIKNGGKAAEQMGNFHRAMNRVLIVVPLWYAFRQAFMGVIQGFSEGFKQIEEFSRAFSKAKAVIVDANMSMEEAFTGLEEKVRGLSLSTGESVEKLLSVFYRFGEVGIKYQDAIRMMDASTKLAMATQGDADQIATAYALAFRLLGNTISKTIPEQERELSVSAKMYKLWQINAFEQNEFNEALRQFLPVANTMNLTLDQTIALLSSLHSAGLKGSQAGTLLRTSFMKFIEALPAVGEKLGMKIVPEKIGIFGSLMEVLGKLKEVKDSGKLEELEGYFEDIFGGIRGAQPARALVAVFDLLNQNMDISLSEGEKLKVFMDEFAKRVENVTDSTFKQMEMFRNNKKHIWEAFIIGITGGKDFDKALKKINETMDSAVEGTKIFAQSLRDLWMTATVVGYPYIKHLEKVNEKLEITGTLQDKISRAMQGKLNYGQLQGLESEVKVTPEIELGGLNKERILETLNLMIKKKEEQIKLDIENEEKLKLQKQQLQEQGNLYDGIVKTLDKEVLAHQNKIKYLQMELDGVNDLEIAQSRLVDRVNDLVNEYNKLKEQGKPVTPIDTQQIVSFIQGKQYSEILKLTNNRILNEEKIKELIKLQAQVEEENIKFSATINTKEKERLSIEQSINKTKAEGVLNTEELLQYEILLKEHANYYNTAKEKELELIKLRNQLEIEHINRTKDLTNKEKEEIDISSNINISKKLGIMNSLQLLEYEKQLVEQSQYAYTEHEKKLKLYQLEKDELEEIIGLTAKYADEFKSSFQGGLKDLFLGKTDVMGFLSGIREKMADMWATSMSTGMTNALGETGIFANFGSIFGGVESGLGGQIKTAHYEGISRGCLLIKQAHMEGIAQGIGTIGGGSNGGGITGGGFNIPSGFPFSQKLGGNMGSFWGNQSWGQGLMGFGMGAMSGMQQGGIGGGIAGGLGSLFMASGHPILAMIGMIPSLISGLKAKKTVTEEQHLISVPSKIDVTNRQLEILNRNFVGFKNAVTYILMRSAYFSEKRGNIEDEFSVQSMRGLT